MSRWSGIASEAMLSRRRLCQAGALLAGWGCVSGGAAFAIGPGRPDFQGKESLYTRAYPPDDPANITTTTCLGCHGACPVRMSAQDGALVKMDGNPWSPRVYGGRTPTDPASAARLRGWTCARGQARLQNTHDPLRIVRPLRRVGERGGRTWRSIGIDGVAAALRDGLDGRPGLRTLIANARLPDDFMILVDPRQVDRVSVLTGLASVLGNNAPLVHMGDPQPWMAAATERFTGQPGWRMEPRWDRVKGFLAWGADPLASGPDPVGDSHHLLPLDMGRDRKPLVVVDPRLSDVASHADFWLPVQPGGDRALAWMFLRAWVELGLIAPPTGWFDIILAAPWSELEVRAGLGRGIVVEAAELLASCGAGLGIRVGGGVGERPDGVGTTETILRLGVAMGAAGPGGAMEPRRYVQRPGQRPVDALAETLKTARHPAMVVVVDDGGLLDTPHWPIIRAALVDPMRVGILVVVSTTLHPVAALADIVVPDVTELERGGLVVRDDGISLVRPVVPSMLAATGLEAPLDRGLEGFLEILANAADARLDGPKVLADAIQATGQAQALDERGWVSAPAAEAAPPVVAFAASASMDVGEPVEGLALVSYREGFAGFTDSSAQYWAQASLRRGNAAWLHPSTAKELKLPEGGRLGFGGKAHAKVELTEGIRPGSVALAVGYGHGEAFEGDTVIDGEAIPKDSRRVWGIDVGELLPVGLTVSPVAAPRAPAQTLRNLLAKAMKHAERT